MNRRWFYLCAVTLLLGVMLALMLHPMHEETATVDEPVFLGAGYSYWRGYRYYFNVEHPPLMQLWSALPLLAQPVKWPSQGEKYFDQTPLHPTALTWDYQYRQREKLYPRKQEFYYYPMFEAGFFGRKILYGGPNDAEQMLFWGRFMQALVTVATGLVVFLWARALSNGLGGLLALAAWVFNPLALAYGHLVITDPGISLFLPLAVWLWACFLEEPRRGRAMAAGLACGAALLTKYTAIILAPIFVVLTALAWWSRWRRGSVFPWRHVAVGCGLLASVVIAVILVVYFPHLRPAPSVSPEDGERWKVPGWFVTLRPVLVPRDYFKGLAIMLLHVASGHENYLLGEWSRTGWWYYFPLAMLVKTPLALLLLVWIGLVLGLRRVRELSFAEWAPVVAAVVYLACAMFSRANIGIRHVLPVYPLVTVAAAAQLGRAGPRAQVLGLALAIWLAGAAVYSHPFYLEYFNELAGGARDGQEYLVDSNYDWGQGGKRLKTFIQDRELKHLYIDFFGVGSALRYYELPVTPVEPEQARQLRDAHLAVSASYLVKPEYAWLRENHRPIARPGCTMFVYHLP